MLLYAREPVDTRRDGSGFASVGRQYKITTGEHDYFLNLLFFHSSTSGCADS